MLQIKNLSITMKKDLRRLTENLSFSLNPGDRLAIIGEEGNGKSTLLKCIWDESLIQPYAEVRGTVQKKGMVLGYLPQELPAGDGALSVYEFCCEEPAFLDASPKELREAARQLGLPAHVFYDGRALSTLSGGEKVKLRLALLSLRRPDAYLLDEPSNDLDLSTLSWLEKFIVDCPAPVLYISHDEVLLERTATVILHLEQLRRKTLPRHTLSKLGYRQYVDQRLQKFAHQEQVARKEQADSKKQQERLQEIYQKVEHRQNTVSRQDPHSGRLLKKKMKAVKSLEHRLDRESETMTELPDSEDAILASFGADTALPQGKTVLELHVEKLEAAGNLLAQNISLTVKGPVHLCIVGKNGAGKTTLLRKIAEELLPRRDIRAAYMPQDYGETVDWSQTPVEFLASSGEKADLTKARTYLGSMKYTPEECSHKISQLSGGQKAKLFFLKMILDGNNVLILDEPTRNFSPLSGPVIRSILREFPGAILSVSHDRKYIEEVCPLLYTLTPEGLEETTAQCREGS